MFSLIITIVAIALVAVLALATLYYGGTAFNQGSARATAAKVMTQAQQIMGAADLYRADTGNWPASMDELLNNDYLKSIPVAQNELVGTALAQGSPWVMPLSGHPVFTVSPMTTDACKAINQMALSLDGIPQHAVSTWNTQCFGANLDAFTAVISKDSGEMAIVIDPVILPPPDCDTGWTVPPSSCHPVVVGGLTISSNSVTFPNTAVGSHSGPVIGVTLTNGSGAGIDLGSFVAVDTTNFTVGLGSCTGTLANLASCTLSFDFGPSAASALSTTATLTWPGHTAGFTLTGTGTSGGGDSDGLTISSNSVTFPNTAVGSHSGPVLGVTLTNGSGAGIDLGSFVAVDTTNFTVGLGTCTGTLADLASCTLSFDFGPSAASALSTTATLAWPGHTAGFTLTGTGTSSGSPPASIDISYNGARVGKVMVSDGVSWTQDFDMGTLELGTFSPDPDGYSTDVYTFVVTNTSGVALPYYGGPVNGPLGGGGNYSTPAGSCATLPSGLAAGASCTLNLRLLKDSPGGIITVDFSMNELVGVDYALGHVGIHAVEAPLLPLAYLDDLGNPLSTLAMPNTAPNATSEPVTVWVQNTGETDLTFASGAATIAAPFSINSDGCSTVTLAPYSSCTVALVFSPTAAQSYAGPSYQLGLTALGGAVPSLPVTGTGADAPLPTFLQIVPAAEFTYFQKADGSWWFAGYENAQSGLGLWGYANALIPIPALNGATQIVTTAWNIFARFSDGHWAGAGGNGGGELGLGHTNYVSTFTTIPALQGATIVSANEDATIAKLANGSWAGAGGNWGGELGLGDRATHSSFTVIPALAGATQVEAADYVTFARLANGSWVAAGSNYYGTMGIGETLYLDSSIHSSFVTVPSLAGAIRVVSGHFRDASYVPVFAQYADGTWATAGQGRFGESGLGDDTAANVFTPVGALNGASQVIVADRLTVVKLANGSWTWMGSTDMVTNPSGPTPANLLSPTAIEGVVNSDALSLGPWNLFVQHASGSAKAAGYNYNGQLGVGNDDYIVWPYRSVVDATTGP